MPHRLGQNISRLRQTSPRPAAELLPAPVGSRHWPTQAKILDLATGTGVIARQLATQGSDVMASDISGEQVRMASELARMQGLKIDFQVASADETQAADSSIDVVTTDQCFLYFDTPRVLASLQRWLKPDGMLVISHFSWPPEVDLVAKASEALILQHNRD